MNFIDVHCHINGEDYGDVASLLQNIQSAGVKKIITVGFDLPSTEYCCRLAEKYPFVYFTAGFHPTELKCYRAGDLEKIENYAAHAKCVAIGEIGLDYHYPDTDKILQREVFLKQLELAEKLNMPVQIHSRDCAEDMLGILKEYAPRLKAGALLHCYSHSVEIAKELEKLGLYFSFGGTSTYSGSKKAKRCIAALGADRLLTETDSPYLAPASKHGAFPNTPESIPEILKNMADIRKVSAEQMAETVWTNAHNLFKKLKN
ncbi:MAG: TatD family hydrolase [Clostridia bacterium]|nr:TatD family hydrolase [Clostridia bacterium]